MKNLKNIMMIAVLVLQTIGYANTRSISSRELFVTRIVEKQLFLENIAMDRSRLFKISSSERFVSRIEKKQASLESIAFRKESLTQNFQNTQVKTSDEAYINRLEHFMVGMVSAK